MLATYPSIKVWCAGCSTGEEAYSLAILLHEEGLLDRSIIYATDINAQSLRTRAERASSARRGFAASPRTTGARAARPRCPTTTIRPAPTRRIMDPALRRKITFSDHSLATDNVFSEVHLVTCRNVLIYFDHALQTRALRLFGEALVHRGFLGLGSKESLRFTRGRGSVRRISRLPERIYRKKAPRDAALRSHRHRRIGGRHRRAAESCCRGLTRNSAPAVAIVIHLPAEGPNVLHEILAGPGAPPMKLAEDKEPIAPGTIYFAPPDYHLLVESGRTFALSLDDRVHFSRPAIDVLFESAAEAYR